MFQQGWKFKFRPRVEIVRVTADDAENMPSLRYFAESKEDLNQIARYIAHDKPLAARRWVQMLRKNCRLTAKHPEVGDARQEFGDPEDSWRSSKSFEAKRTNCKSRRT